MFLRPLPLAVLTIFLFATACSTFSEIPIPDNSAAVTVATEKLEMTLACPEPLPSLVLCPDNQPAMITKSGKPWCPAPELVVAKVQSAPLKDATAAALTWALDEQEGRLRLDTFDKPCREKSRSSSATPENAASRSGNP